VCGLKGTGKSTLIEHLHEGIEAVGKVDVFTLYDKDRVADELAKQILGDHVPLIFDTQLLLKAVKDCKTVPTVIFDVQYNLGIQAAGSLSKSQAPFCKCIIILSKANSIIEFERDKARQHYVYIDDLTEAEAKELLVQRGKTLAPILHYLLVCRQRFPTYALYRSLSNIISLLP
jgi:hypothetical protein